MKWAESLLLCGVLTGLVEVLVPSGKTSKAVSFVLSLFLLTSIVKPLVALITGIEIESTSQSDIVPFINNIDSSAQTNALAKSIEEALTSGNESFNQLYIRQTEAHIADIVTQSYVQACLDPPNQIEVQTEQTGTYMDVNITLYVEGEEQKKQMLPKEEYMQEIAEKFAIPEEQLKINVTEEILE